MVDSQLWRWVAWVADDAWCAKQAARDGARVGGAIDVERIQGDMEEAGLEYVLPPAFKQVPRLLR